VPQTSDPAKEHNVVGHELLTVVATVDPGTGATVLTVAGEADMLTAPVLRQRLEEHFCADRAPIIVDLSRVEFFGSTALPSWWKLSSARVSKAAISSSWLGHKSYGDRWR